MSAFDSKDQSDIPVPGNQVEGFNAENQFDVDDEDNLAELDAEIGDEGPDEYDEHSGLIDEEMEKEMEELTKDLEEVDTRAGAPKGEVPAGALPTDKGGRLSSHAAEFWFPDCRNCSCCKGYKHGCDCVKKERFIACQHESCNLDPSHKDQKLPEDLVPAARAPSENSSYQVRRAFSDGTPVCRFDQQQPGSCRFGNNCRFLHTSNRGQQNQSRYAYDERSTSEGSGRGFQSGGHQAQSHGGFDYSSQHYGNGQYYQQQPQRMNYNQSQMQQGHYSSANQQYQGHQNYYDNSSDMHQYWANKGFQNNSR